VGYLNLVHDGFIQPRASEVNGPRGVALVRFASVDVRRCRKTEGCFKLSDFCFPTRAGIKLAPLTSLDLIPGSSEDAFFQPEVLRRDWHFATYDNGIRILATIGVEMPELRSCMESYLNKWFSVPDDCTNLNLVCDWWESISSTIYHFPSVVAAALVFHAFNTFSAPLPVPVFLCPFMPGFCLEMEGTDHRSLSYPQRLCSLSALGTFDIFTREIDERAPPLPPTFSVSWMRFTQLCCLM